MPQSADPLISVILPVYDGRPWLERALASIAASTFRDYELVVVDDGSTDDSAAIIERHGPDLFLRNECNLGVSAARNRAVERARGRILYFTDADVVIAPDTLARVAAHFAAGRRSVIGLYSSKHPNAGLCSRYKNAWIRYSYLAAPRDVEWFFTAVGAVDAELFRRHGGFDAELDVRTGGSDIDFGRRLADDGVRTLLDERMSVVHLKAYSFTELMRNEIARAYGFSRLGLSTGHGLAGIVRRGVGNVSMGFAASSVLAGLAVASTALVGRTPLAVSALAASLVGYACVNRGFYRHLLSELPVGTALACLPLMFVDHLVCGLGAVAALAERYLRVPVASVVPPLGRRRAP